MFNSYLLLSIITSNFIIKLTRQKNKTYDLITAHLSVIGRRIRPSRSDGTKEIGHVEMLCAMISQLLFTNPSSLPLNFTMIWVVIRVINCMKPSKNDSVSVSELSRFYYRLLFFLAILFFIRITTNSNRGRIIWNTGEE